MKKTVSFLQGTTLDVEKINGFIFITLSVLITLALFIENSSFVLLTALPTILYSSILILIVLNWSKSRHLRLGVGLSSLLVLLSILINIGNLDFIDNYLIRSILVILGMVTIANVRVGEKSLNMISVLMTGLLFVYFIRSFGYVEMYVITLSQDFSNTIANPNSKGIVTLAAFLIASRGAVINNKLFNILIPLIAFIALYNYDSRASLLCAIIYFLLANIIKKDITTKRKTLYIILVIISLLFPVLYVAYYNSIPNPESIEIMGKSFYSGRQALWAEALNISNTGSIWIGTHQETLSRLFDTSNWHNIYIAMLHKFGLIFYITFIVTIYKSIVKNNNVSYKAYVSLLIILILGSFETVLLNGGYDSMLILLLLMNTGKHSGNANSISTRSSADG